MLSLAAEAQMAGQGVVFSQERRCPAFEVEHEGNVEVENERGRDDNFAGGSSLRKSRHTTTIGPVGKTGLA
jgi:hypothetical protein